MAAATGYLGLLQQTVLAKLGTESDKKSGGATDYLN